MLNKEKLFGNLFADPKITTPRLVNFAADSLAKIAAGDTEEKLKDYAAAVQRAHDTVAAEVQDVDQTAAQQKGKTRTVDEVSAAFIDTMQQKEGVIADALGGYGSPAYLEFYPNGTREYTRMTRIQAPVLIARIWAAAEAHGAALPPALKVTLQGYKQAFADARDTQQDKMGEVSDNRDERNDARIILELALTALVREAAAIWPGDVAQCSRFFAFHLLDAPRHKSMERNDEPNEGPAPQV